MDGRQLVLVCGEALIDVTRLPDGSERRSPGGGPFNTARALARLGVPTMFLGRLSTDAAGQQLYRLLESDGVDLSPATIGAEPTTTALATIGPDGSAAYRFVTDGTSAPNLTPEMLPATLSENVSAIHVGTLGLVLEPISSAVMALLQRDGARRLVMVDPNVRQDAIRDPDASRTRIGRVIAQTAIVKASEEDVAWLYPGLDLLTAAGQILACGPRLVVVTLGAQGALGITDRLQLRVPAPVVDVVDTIGAGDAFGAALLAWLQAQGAIQPDLRLSANQLESALSFACRVASASCSHAGAEPPERAPIRA